MAEGKRDRFTFPGAENFRLHPIRTKTPRERGFRASDLLVLLRLYGAYFGGIDVDEAPVLAAVLVAHHAGDLGEQGIVLAAAHVGAGIQLGAALAHDDRRRRALPRRQTA